MEQVLANFLSCRWQIQALSDADTDHGLLEALITVQLLK